MRFEKQMIETASSLELNKGYCVLQCVYFDKNKKLTNDEMLRIKEAHKKKIDMSDAIFVMNVGGYIGESTRNEIDYAKKHGKDVLYFGKLGEINDNNGN